MSKKKKKKSVDVSIKLNGLDKEDLILSKFATVNLKGTSNDFIYLDKLDDGTWMLVVTEGTLDNIKELVSLEFVRGCEEN